MKCLVLDAMGVILGATGKFAGPIYVEDHDKNRRATRSLAIDSAPLDAAGGFDSLSRPIDHGYRT